MPSAAQWMIGAAAILPAAAAGGTLLAIRQRSMQYWLPSALWPAEPAPPSDDEQPIDVLLAVCDHYEPEWNRPSHAVSVDKVQRWVREYPRLFEAFRDDSGRPPQHSFFFPQDEYRPEYLDLLSPLCHAGYGDVDVHLHHDNDTPDSLEQKLATFRDALFHQHGLLRRDPTTGAIVYGFIHGNWALCNSRPDGRWCGVSQELTILQRTGCYADFTMPSAPSPTQTRTINSIYFARDIPGRCKSHDVGERARAGSPPPPESLLMIQGPLGLDWASRKFGVIPRTENGDLHAGRPATLRRLQLWLNAAVHVAGRRNTVFIKLHTHGCKDGNIDELLGPRTVQFHADLQAWRKKNPRFRLHYVTAWEMAQAVRNLIGGAGSWAPGTPARELTPHAGPSPGGTPVHAPA